MFHNILRELKLYTIIGIANTLIHFIVFFIFVYFSFSNAVSNIVAFFSAATFSFFANAKWTFQKQTNKKRYILFLLTMGSLAFMTGWVTDDFNVPAIFAVILFSFISWFIGFIASKKLIFK